ncbi:DEAD-box ATP-dependent RNA helicase 30, related [Eimeria maxima]|uniref:DEAD-box ATP-dependent RNA helicase 30, related n=1 Tax=Eimeria maxima TaxID=5804 RepID=U6MHE7_EIMMA|nr:DEAD-box ATP-dependent RNA helicase 30, related [Eimeria maxima]CDJ61035.1 DEAD-box ATP-dependent RNA helicase 30, related [Eimeria maxima]
MVMEAPVVTGVVDMAGVVTVVGMVVMGVVEVDMEEDMEVVEVAMEGDMVEEGVNVPKPCPTFEHTSFPSYLLDAISAAGFQKPTPIQLQGWPIALSGRDMIGIAETGSGKTLAFLLPGIVHINAQPYLRSGDGPIALILAPTRELVEQIRAQCRLFASPSKINHAGI